MTELFEHSVCFEITATINSEPVLRNLKIEEKRYGVWRKRGAEEHRVREAFFSGGDKYCSKVNGVLYRLVLIITSLVDVVV